MPACRDGARVTGWSGLRSPVSGRALAADTPHSLSDGAQRWPVVQGIPFLRANRRPLAGAALDALDSGQPFEAEVILLADQDDWARTPPPGIDARRSAARQAGALSFRSAMDLLAFGAVGTYFAHRWSDPTFLSGLALAEAHRVPGPVLELACGAGHFLREFARVSDAPVYGADVVFAKLWLARHYVAPTARLLCFDAADPWPFADDAVTTVFCHDAFYFLPAKPHVAAEMRRVASGPVLVGHAHNAAVENLSAGSPLTPAGYAALFGNPHLYDDRDLTAALVEQRAPIPAPPEALLKAPAVSMATGGPPRTVAGGMAMPAPGAALRRNPLYENGEIRWPSPRYESEYAPLATYPLHAEGPLGAHAGDTPAIDALARRRVLLDLPDLW